MSAIDRFPNTAELVFSGADGEPFTTSLVIAQETGVQHKNVVEMIRANLDDLNEIGRVAFETRPFDTAGGAQVREVAELDEVAATLLITYMRNNDIVRAFKKRLVAAFFAMRQILAERAEREAAHPLQGPELLAAAVLESQKMIEARDARIHQLEADATVAAPKVRYVDTYVTDADLLSFSTVASSNNVTESWLRELLLAKDWIYRQEETRWSNRENKKVTRYRYSEKADKKRYFRRVEVHEAPRFRGEVMHTLKITPQGAEAIARLVSKEIGGMTKSYTYLYRARVTYLYRARVISYPEGSHKPHRFLGEEWQVPVEGWAPPGWVATTEYIERLGTDQFIWPVVGRQFKNRRTVKRRVELLESYGATAVVERSTRIEWPEVGA